jgi:hypothetical protein
MEKIVVSRNETDSVIYSVINQFLERAKIGKEKYGTDLDRKDLSLLEWIEHAKQENMDFLLYLEKVKQMLLQKEKDDLQTK